MTIRARIVTGAFVAAALAAPIGMASTNSDATSTAAPACLSHVTSQGNDPVCAGYSNGQPIVGGTPDFGVFGPNGTGRGIGVSTGSLLPGQSWNAPIG